MAGEDMGDTGDLGNLNPDSAGEEATGPGALSGALGVVVAAVVGAVVAVAVSVGIVTSLNAAPEPVNSNYIVYNDSASPSASAS